MALLTDVNDIIRVLQNSQLCDDETKAELAKLKSDSNQWQRQIQNLWVNLNIPVFSKTDVRTMNDEVYRMTKNRNIARQKLREFYIRHNNFRAANDLSDLPETSKSGKHCVMKQQKQTKGWIPGLQQWVVIENDQGQISIDNFSHCIEKCTFTSALNLPLSLERLLKEAEYCGLSELQIRDLLLDFIRVYRPNSLLTAHTFAASAHELLNFIIGLVNTAAEVEKVRTALQNVSREPGCDLMDAVLKVKSLTTTLLLLSTPMQSKYKIEKRSNRIAMDAVFDFVATKVQDGLRAFKQRSAEVDRLVDINMLVAEALKLESLHGKPVGSMMVSEKAKHVDSLSAYYTRGRGDFRDKDQKKSFNSPKNDQQGPRPRSLSNSNRPRSSSGQGYSHPTTSSRHQSRDSDRQGSRGRHSSRSWDRSPNRRSPGGQRGSDRRSGSRDRKTSSTGDKGRMMHDKAKKIYCVRCGSSHFAKNCRRYPYFTSENCENCGLAHPTDLCCFNKESRYLTPTRDLN